MCKKMSNVRLSNGSPTLEWVDARPTDHSKPSICRNLFGTGDPEERKKESSLLIEDMTKNFSEKYNYDFINDKPLPTGQYEWEPVESRDVAEFYTRPPHRRVYAFENEDHNGNHDCRVSPSSPTNEPRLSEDAEKSELQADCPHSHNEARKRPASPGSESPSKKLRSSEEVEDLSNSIQQTPSKKDSRTHEH